MIDKNRSLIKLEKSIFRKFIDYVKDIFKKRKNKKIENFSINEKKFEDLENKQVVEVLEEKHDTTNESISEKECFFELYFNVKSGKINMKDLSVSDLIKFNSLIKEEVELKKQNIYKQEELMKSLSEEIKELKRENKILRQKIN